MLGCTLRALPRASAGRGTGHAGRVGHSVLSAEAALLCARVASGAARREAVLRFTARHLRLKQREVNREVVEVNTGPKEVNIEGEEVKTHIKLTCTCEISTTGMKQTTTLRKFITCTTPVRSLHVLAYHSGRRLAIIVFKLVNISKELHLSWNFLREHWVMLLYSSAMLCYYSSAVLCYYSKKCCMYVELMSTH